jgi:CRISPR-associated endonuclease Csn1
MGSYVLGLDLGTTSVGWAAIELDSRGEFIGLAKIHDGAKLRPAIGSRVFEAGVDGLGQGAKEATKNALRREKRGLRRTIRRRAARRRAMMAKLLQLGWVPNDTEARQAWVHTDDAIYPYKLRAKGLQEKLTLQEFARALYHLAQRRGFQSNKKSAKKKEEDGAIKEAIARLRKELGGQTLGEFWHEQLSRTEPEHRGQPIRNRSESYHWVADRAMYEDEFQRLWKQQENYHPAALTGDLKARFEQILFFQRNFELSNRKKRKVIGRCSLIPGQQRCSLADRRAQEFRLLQKVADLMLVDSHKRIPLTAEQRQIVLRELAVNSKRSFDQLRKALQLPDTVKFNLEFDGNDDLLGHAIDSMLAKATIFGKDEWLALDESRREAIWARIRKYLDSDESQESLLVDLKAMGVAPKKPDAIDDIRVPDSHVAYSVMALDRLLPFMREGKNLYTAIKDAGFVRSWKVLRELPLPDKAHDFDIRNPIVRAVLFQVRKVVNSLIRELGKPQEIVIEFARDLKARKERRQEMQQEMAIRQRENDRYCEYIASQLGYAGPENVKPVELMKFRLWKEQNFRCPYSGQTIDFDQLLGSRRGDTEIDHILPRSLSFDDSLNNKVVCLTASNRDKGQRTPFDWLSGDAERWHRVESTIDHWNPQRRSRDRRVEDKDATQPLLRANPGKWERFYVTKEQIETDYTPTQLLNDTSSISVEVHKYLSRLYPARRTEAELTHTTATAVRTTKGGVTAQLRRFWGLDRLLSGETDIKNRDDLRHHTLDAVVVALTGPKMIQTITRQLQARVNKPRGERYVLETPWPEFVTTLDQALDQVVVSHRVNRAVRGRLHEETFYHRHIDSSTKEERFSVRKRLSESFSKGNIESIVDPTIRGLVLKHFEDNEENPKKAFAKVPLTLTWTDAKTQAKRSIVIRHVRIWTDKATILLRGTHWVRPDENHHISFFRVPENGKWIRYVCSRYEAAQRLAQKHPIITRQHPDFPDAEFIMSLSKKESLLIADENKQEQVCRVMTLGSGTAGRYDDVDVWLFVHNAADRTPSRERDIRIRSLKKFAAMNPRKVTIDTFGRIRWAND